MKQQLYKFSFDSTVSFRDVRRFLFLAVRAAEALHGRSLIRLDGLFYLQRKKRSCVVDSATEVGRTIAIIFIGFITYEFGEEAFKVERDET